VVAIFAPWILAVPDHNYLLLEIDVAPFDLANLLLAHCRCDRKADNASHRDDRVGIVVEVFEHGLDFVVTRPSISFMRTTDKTKPSKRNSAKTDALGVD